MNTATNIQIKPDKTNLEKFYMGWPHFSSMSVEGNAIEFRLPSPSLVKDAYAEAQKRINLLCLPLEAKLIGHPLLSNIFIVKEINQNSFERLSEQMGVCHA